MISGDLSLKVRKDWLLQCRYNHVAQSLVMIKGLIHIALLFQYKDRIYQLLREARLYNPSLPNFDR